MALASVGAGAIYFLVIIVILNAYIDNKRRQKEPQLIRVIRDMKERMAMDEVHYLISRITLINCGSFCRRLLSMYALRITIMTKK